MHATNQWRSTASPTLTRHVMGESVTNQLANKHNRLTKFCSSEIRSWNRPDIISVCCFRCLLTSMWHYGFIRGNTATKDSARFPPVHNVGKLPRLLIGGGRSTWPCLEYATRAHFDYLSGSLHGTVGRSHKGTCLVFLSLWKAVWHVGASTRCLQLLCPTRPSSC